jgi:hypothetical protein
LSVRLNVPENGQTIFFFFYFENFVSLKIKVLGWGKGDSTKFPNAEVCCFPQHQKYF